MADVGGDRAQLLQALFRETALLFHRLRSAAEELHGHGPLTAGLRSVMIDLYEGGARTVPDLARERPVARQYMLKLVRHLQDFGWAETSPNPRHRRSYLVSLTAAGAAMTEEILSRERTLLGTLPLIHSTEELRIAVRVLADARASIAAGQR